MTNNILKRGLYAAMLAVGAASFTGCTDLSETVYSQLPGDGSYTLTNKDIQAMYGPIYDRLRDMYNGWEGYQDISGSVVI